MLAVLLATGEDGHWHPGIGDPTLVGWVTVAAYFAAAFLAYRAHRACAADARAVNVRAPAEAEAQRRLASLWLFVLAMMLLLGLNKQLDLQTLFTDIMRTLFKRFDLYEERRKFQIAFVAGMALASAVLVAGLTFTFWRVLRRALGAVIGLGVIVTFVVVRAASFHHIDLVLRSGPLPLNVVLELGGIVVLAVSAYRAAQHGSLREPAAAGQRASES